MKKTVFERGGSTTQAGLRHEVEKRYLAYALSTIVSRALPDVRDGLKPVHRRILYAMHAMRLDESSKMRKSAAVIGEVIGKYHPHGDQAAYDALVRMAQDFSLRYPLIEGSGNFGSVDGDAPAAMRYTETRLSAFAGLLLREIDQGTTTFRPTYDAMGEEPEVFPAGVPNLLLNGSSGIAVGMSCSFPPHNLGEVISACREAIKTPGADTSLLLRHIKGPDFPTGGEIIVQSDSLEEIYRTGHGALRVRGTFSVETIGRGGKVNLILTSIPYSVNKSRLIERIANLIREKRLKQAVDVRDESTDVVRIVVELRGGEVSPESVAAFLYRHSDLQISFPVNLIAVTPQGVPDRLSLPQIIRFFLEFRHDTILLRLKHRLAVLHKRIHVLEGFDLLFQDIDQALKIIRSARNRQEAAQGLKKLFLLDDEQVDAILEMRLYRLVGMEIGRILEELLAKRMEALELSRNIESPQRLWKIVDRELADIGARFGDTRRTEIKDEKTATAVSYDPDEFAGHEDNSVILSRQGWIRRMKTHVGDASSLKFRDGDSLFGWTRVNTSRTVAIFSNLGKVYVLRAIDVPVGGGFGEPMGNLFGMADGESVVGFLAPDVVSEGAGERDQSASDGEMPSGEEPSERQGYLFAFPGQENNSTGETGSAQPSRGILATKFGKGFRFSYEILREPSKRIGRRLAVLQEGDEVVAVRQEDGDLTAVGTDDGYVLVFPTEQLPILSGPGQGVRMVKLKQSACVIVTMTVDPYDELRVRLETGSDQVVSVESTLVGNRGGRGRKVVSGLVDVERVRGRDGEKP